MNGFTALLGKEFLEIRRTWRLWVLPGILLAVGLSSPILAAITPWLLESLATGDAGVIIELPDPEPVHAYLQFVQMSTQIVLLALIVVTAGMVSGERRSGTAVLVLTKPVSASAFLISKWIAQTALVVVALVPATLICWLGTLLIFDEAPVTIFLESVLIFAMIATLLVAVMLVCSTLVNSMAGAAGIGFGVYVLLTIFSGWGPTQRFSPAGLYSAAGNVLLDGDPPVLIPALSSLLAIAVLIAFAVWLFKRQELSSRLGSS